MSSSSPFSFHSPKHADRFFLEHGTMFAKKSMERINHHSVVVMKKLELSEKIDASKQRIAQTVQKTLEQNKEWEEVRDKTMELGEKFNGAVNDAASTLASKWKSLQQQQKSCLTEEEEEEEAARRLMLESEELCTKAMIDHLLEFIERRPTSTYEEWIEELHPENLHHGKLLPDMSKELDHRFYVKESDHRKMWNSHLDTLRRYVNSRSSIWDQTTTATVSSMPDLLSDETITLKINTNGSDIGNNDDADLLNLECTEPESNTTASSMIKSHHIENVPWGDFWGNPSTFSV